MTTWRVPTSVVRSGGEPILPPPRPVSVAFNVLKYLLPARVDSLGRRWCGV